MAYLKPISKFDVSDKYFSDDYPHNGVKPYAHALFSASIVAGTEVSISNVTYTFVAALTTNPATVPYEVLASGVAATDAKNFAMAVNGEARTEGSEEYSDGTVAHPLVNAIYEAGETSVLIQFPIAGTEGNEIAVTSDDAKIAWADAASAGDATASLVGGRLATPAPHAVAFIPDPLIAANTIVMTSEPVDVRDTDKWKTYVLA